MSTAALPPAAPSTPWTDRAARRALYIDFEGRIGKPPVLLGVLHGTRYQVFVLDEAFGPLARSNAIPDASVRVCSLDDAVAEVVRLAGAGRGRRIVAFSEHELQMVREHTVTLADAFATSYLNVLAEFRRWYNRTRQTRPLESFGLDACETWTGYHRPAPAECAPADLLRRLRAQLDTAARRGVAPGAHTIALWTQLVRYNQHDCLGMRHLAGYVAEACSAEAHVQRQQGLADAARRKRRRDARKRRASAQTVRGAHPTTSPPRPPAAAARTAHAAVPAARNQQVTAR